MATVLVRWLSYKNFFGLKYTWWLFCYYMDSLQSSVANVNKKANKEEEIFQGANENYIATRKFTEVQKKAMDKTTIGFRFHLIG